MSDFNAFNKFKGLLHREHFENINSGNFLPPYCVCTDPSNMCNQNCVYCNSNQYRRKSPGVMTKKHLLNLASFYKDWRIQSTIIEGGGEPLINTNTMCFIDQCQMYDIEVGIITNGVLINKSMFNSLSGIRFIGISFDASNKKTYKAIRGTDDFNAVVGNVTELNKHKKSVDVNLKMLIQEHNYTEIYDFAKLAKEMGCNGAHIKPVAYENLPIKKYDLSQHTKEINEGILKAKELESNTFEVHAVMYKFGDTLEHKVKFNKCTSTPIGGVFGADGNFWLCYNMRGINGFKLGSHNPDPYNIKRLWGGNYHKSLINDIDIGKCMRCGLTGYNEISENCIKQDKLFWKFL